ncbi:DUF2171 domain-containing protein [Alteriqipengyuania flavescens]|uniref:DUF2171 domain-containing protein n=1 Tax=Alteriqipengyuania flavescens TaxID=3053610 RepID=UPI0025B5DED6|nr:DUF2171 domain-containing protein [Alteriqipengyuania flavescens]WJY19896.1 DUF2171 domain-containing protein [Alteriqipengyuania flavescens]WJY25839.1 DUF2171 domain-containing protein [Alteriqipengyuania flavescens]
MSRQDKIEEHMEFVGADGVHLGTVDRFEGNRIKMIGADSGSHGDQHHYISVGLVASVEVDKFHVSATGASAALLEEEKGSEPNFGQAVSSIRSNQLRSLPCSP